MDVSEDVILMGALQQVISRLLASIKSIEKRLDALEDDGLVVCDQAGECGDKSCEHHNPHEYSGEACNIDICRDIDDYSSAVCIPTKVPNP